MTLIAQTMYIHFYIHVHPFLKSIAGYTMLVRDIRNIPSPLTTCVVIVQI